MVELKPVTKNSTLNRKSHVDMNYNQTLHFVFQHVDILPTAEESVPGQAVFFNDSLWIFTAGRGWVDVLVGKVVAEPEARMAVYTIEEPTTLWEIDHDLNQLALMECISTEGQLINGDVQWQIGGNARSLSGQNRITVGFSEPMAGFVVLMEDKDAEYETVYEFSTAAKKWTIQHDLGQLVAVQCIDTDGQKIRGTTHWDLIDMDSVTINFNKAQMGWAVIAGGDPDVPTHVYDFTDSAEWVIDHGLGRYCEVQLMDTNGKAIKGDVVWDPSLDRVTVAFSQPLSGKALVI